MMGRLLFISILASAGLAIAAPTGQPASAPAAPKVDPFSRLKVVSPRDRLPPLATVRPRSSSGKTDRSKRTRRVVIKVASNPRGASVSWGGKVLGTTPLMISGHPRATPMDLTLRRGGYMLLRSRIMRRASRSYYLKLVPAKFR